MRPAPRPIVAPSIMLAMEDAPPDNVIPMDTAFQSDVPPVDELRAVAQVEVACLDAVALRRLVAWLRAGGPRQHR